MPASAVIELRDVDINTDRDAVVRRLSVDVVAGRVLAIVAERSETTRAIANVLCGRTDGYRVEGDLVLDDRELLSRTQTQAQAEQFVAMVMPDVSSRDEIGALLRTALGAGRRDDVAHAVQALLEEVGLPASATSTRAQELNAADRIRLSFALALARRPRVVVVDLPYWPDATTLFTTYSDLLHDLSRSTDVAWVVTTDSLAVTADIADDVIVLFDGCVVERGSVYDVCLRPAMPYTRDLLLVTPRPHRPLPDASPSVDVPSDGGCQWATNCREHLLPICRTQVPALHIVGPGHEAACHLLERHG